MHLSANVSGDSISCISVALLAQQISCSAEFPILYRPLHDIYLVLPYCINQNHQGRLIVDNYH
jgi:hypothetical protein